MVIVVNIITSKNTNLLLYTGYLLQKLEKQEQQLEDIGMTKEKKKRKELKNITQHYGFHYLINQENLVRLVLYLVIINLNISNVEMEGKKPKNILILNLN